MNCINKKGALAIIAALLLCVMLFSTLYSCTEEPQGSSDSESVTETDSESIADSEEPIDTSGKLVLAMLGECRVTIVTAEFCTEAEKAAATKVYNKFKNLIGSTPETRDDFLASGQEYDKSSLEILIGRTKYAETSEVLSELGYGDYAIKVIGNKVVICGSSPEGTAKACSEFTMLMQRYTSKKTLLIDKGLTVTEAILPFANDIPTYEGKRDNTYFVNDTGDGCMAVTLSGTDRSCVDEYAQGLTSKGYALYDTRSLGDGESVYAQYTGEVYTLTLLYTDYEKTLRIFLEPLTNTALPMKEAEDYIPTGEENLLLQVGITRPGDPVQNGFCYMVRLADGSFIVYDGGMDDTLTASVQYQRQNARRILELMREYGAKNGDGKYVIAAWVITHGHIDHIGALEAFVKAEYETEVDIERIICNLPSDGQIATDESDGDMGAKMSAYRTVLHKAKQEGAVVHKAHPGQVMKLRDATLEILYTYDLVCNTEITAFNNTSVVTRLTVNEQTVMITGDMQGVASNTMISLYGKTGMKADFISVPHHGWFSGGSRVFYECVSPSFVLWPIGEDRRSEVVHNPSYPMHEYFFDNNLKIFYAGDDTTVIPLPYSGTGETVEENKYYD